jgi:two-component system sensor histidine kinase RegB
LNLRYFCPIGNIVDTKIGSSAALRHRNSGPVDASDTTRMTVAVANGEAPTTLGAAPGEARRIRIRTLTLIRWGAIAGQAAAILVTHYTLGFAVPLGFALLVVAASCLLNVALTLGRPVGARLGERAAVWYLAYDIGQLAVLLYLTGGLENPFAFLLLAPVTVSATILSLRSTVGLCLWALLCVTALAIWHMALPWSPGGFALPGLYVLGSWIALCLGIAFFASYTFRVAEEARRMSDALTATQLALAREQQLSALGGLAAAAAHELGSPLGTIAVAARELAREVPKDSPLAEDIQLLISETARCRDILAELAERSDTEISHPFERIPFDATVEFAATRHADDRIDLNLEADGGPGGVPMTIHRPEVVHGIGNLVQNAVQFATGRVDVVTRWSENDIIVTIRDDGPGFPIRLLERLGEPYVSARDGEGEHMGLGVFIAQTLLQRTGARLEFSNLDGRGAQVTVRWRRAALEAAPR